AQRAVGGAASSAGRALGGLPRLSGYQDDNARLEAENARLRGLLRETDGLRRSSAELQRLLATRTVGQYPVVPARVVSVGNSLGFAWTATIDAGSRDGVRAGQTVLAGPGLVGRTKRVGPFTSTVVLLVDPGFTVGGRLARLGGVGLVHGDGARGLRLEVVDADAQVKVGDVVTTTASDTFVPDVPVGRVSRVLTGGSTLTRVAEVAPLVDVREVDLVGVVVGPARTGPRKPLAR
ncbi:MAG: rod shape-determining protein MreC, partial [Frankiales bacterium]|nr:rod shape-determining protein MreC [Frankiales bacterium]